MEGNESQNPERTIEAETGGFESLNQRLWTEMSEGEFLELLDGAICMYSAKS